MVFGILLVGKIIDIVNLGDAYTTLFKSLGAVYFRTLVWGT
ncbi:MAG: hypothetical protein ACTSR3_18465 [Candidatus Helarchaeota archaeon]